MFERFPWLRAVVLLALVGGAAATAWRLWTVSRAGLWGSLELRLDQEHLVPGQVLTGTLVLSSNQPLPGPQVRLELVTSLKYAQPVETADASGDFLQEPQELALAGLDLEGLPDLLPAGESLELPFRLAVPAELPALPPSPRPQASPNPARRVYLLRAHHICRSGHFHGAWSLTLPTSSDPE